LTSFSAIQLPPKFFWVSFMDPLGEKLASVSDNQEKVRRAIFSVFTLNFSYKKRPLNAGPAEYTTIIRQ
jgi:hypothetical protein